jgi:hypothetical protein
MAAQQLRIGSSGAYTFSRTIAQLKEHSLNLRSIL